MFGILYKHARYVLERYIKQNLVDKLLSLFLPLFNSLISLWRGTTRAWI